MRPGPSSVVRGLLFGCLLGSGCGYTLGGGVAAPGGGHSLCVPLVENRTPELWAGVELTSALRRTVERLGLALADSGQAPVLWARLSSLEATPRAAAMFGGAFAAREQEVRVRAVVQLRSAAGAAVGEPLTLDERESFLVAPDLRGTQANLMMASRMALERLAARAAERLLRRF